MSHLLDDDDDLRARRDREINLSTGSILGIFFGLVLICGIFFAFGYNLGQKANTSAATTGTEITNTGSTNFNAFKPSAGSPAGSGASTPLATPMAAPVVNTPTPSRTPQTSPAAVPAEEATSGEPASTHPATITLPRPQPPPPESSSAAAAFIPGSFVVQIAAVSHQEDADLLVGALRSKGYSVAAHAEPGDRLLHIQVGPFNNRRDAEAMRQRLLADGYNAIVK
jgi:DedD protein